MSRLITLGGSGVKRIVYAATFKGTAAPTNDAGTELKAQTRASRLVPLDGDLPAGLGPGASFESTVIIGENGAFAEHGKIDLGGGNTLGFKELAKGTMAPAPDGGSAGAIDWRIESGTGIFAGASGYVTSNFSVSDSGEVVDHQLASIVLP